MRRILFVPAPLVVDGEGGDRQPFDGLEDEVN
jgi:hypothetical protein